MCSLYLRIYTFQCYIVVYIHPETLFRCDSIFHVQYTIKNFLSYQVEVSSPSAESENTLCTTSILGTTMCSKIMTTAASSTHPNNTPTVRNNNNATTIIGKSSWKLPYYKLCHSEHHFNFKEWKYCFWYILYTPLYWF